MIGIAARPISLPTERQLAYWAHNVADRACRANAEQAPAASVDSYLLCLKDFSEPPMVERVIRIEQNRQMLVGEAFTHGDIVVIGA